MVQLSILKELLGNPPVSDVVLQFYLDNARDIICEIRHSDAVETKYLNTQIKIAIEMYNKAGAEGQTGHSENGLSRTYESGDISRSLLSQIIPVASTPSQPLRVIT
jgi:hypothetical protein